ncbi:MAG TPA: type II and III secretion system protein [Thermoanaerobaculia bacterium]|jgi:type II secretory pathway component GspD/PulD (secretin)|nr:type II and III secretion system protein [Thermoanaerobaculia bacterium]
MKSNGLVKMVSILLLILGPAAAEAGVQEAGVQEAGIKTAGIRTIAPQLSGGPLLADVNLDEVSVGRALRLLAETYDVSIATGALPDTRVTIRLRNIGSQEAFAAVAAAAGLEVVQDGSVIRLASRQIAPCGVEADCTVPAVKPAPAGRGACCWNGCGNAGNGHQPPMADRVFPLGVAPGEETLKTVLPLLASCEVATYNAVENQLTISALPATLERIDGLLGELTRTPRQYEIEVQVVEVSRNALRQMGSQGTFGLDIRGGVLASTFPLPGLNDSKRYLPSANDLAALSRFGTAGGVTSGGTEPGSFADPGFRFGHIDARGIGLMIQALEQSGEAHVKASPKVTALDNRRARISMVTTLRIPTFTQNQSFGTTTVSGIEQVDVGTTLEVRPRHGAGRQILLTVTPEVSELQPGSSAVTQNGLTQGLPVVTRRRTETEVVLESGETLIIGGLVTEHKTETHGRTPGLANIPLIGRAFRLEGKQTESTELLVFVTPRELPSPEARRSKVRVGETWLPFNLAAQLEGARAQLHGQAAADRVAGVRALEAIDADLLDAGVDTGREIVALSSDASLDVRAAALLFLLHVRPAAALGELARFKDSRAVALAALAAPMAPHLHAALAELAWQAPPSPSSPTPLPAGTEPALSWAGTPEEIVLSGDAAGIGLVRSALDLLSRRSPDLRHFVGFGLATVETGAARPDIDPAVRSARVVTANMTPERVALQMVRLATLAFETRVAGLPAADGRNLALAVQEETRALERFSGVSASATASPAVRDALAAGLRWITADAPGTAIRPASSFAVSAGDPQ